MVEEAVRGGQMERAKRREGGLKEKERETVEGC